MATAQLHKSPLDGGPCEAGGAPVLGLGRADETPKEEAVRFEKFRERFSRWSGLSMNQKCQVAADLQYPTGPRRFRVAIVPNPECTPRAPDAGQPTVEINCESEFEAQAKYMALCGIRGMGEQQLIQITPVDTAASATPATPPAAEPTDFADADSETVARRLGVETS